MKNKNIHKLSPIKYNTINTIKTPKSTYSSKKIIFNKKNQKTLNIKLDPNFKKELDIFLFDEEYVSKLKYYSPNINIKNKRRESLYNINMSNDFPTIFKKYQIIDNKSFEETKRKLMSKINVKKQIFEKNIFDEMEHTRYIGRLENMYKENTLEKKRNELEIKIKKIKDLMIPLSKELSDTLNQIESSKIDLEIFKNYKNYSLLKSNIKNYLHNESKSTINMNNDANNEVNNIANIDLNNDINNDNNNNNNNSLEKMRRIKREKSLNNKLIMEMIKNKKKTLIEEQKFSTIEKLAILSNKKSNILIKLDSCERDLKDFKERLNVIKNDLLIHYHKLLYEGKDTRKDGLSWIIKSIWNLKSNVIMSFMPKFLDINSISFLFIYSNKLVDIENIQKKIEKINEEIKEKEKKSKKLAKLTKMILKSHRGSFLGNMNMNTYNENNKDNEINNNNNINNNMKKDKNNIPDTDTDNDNSSNNNNNISIEKNNIDNNIISSPHHHRDNTVKQPKIKRLLSQPDFLLQSIQIKENNIEKPKTLNSNLNLNFDETFKTSLYKTNTNSFSKNKSKKSNSSSEKKQKHKKTNTISKNLKKIIFDPEYLDQLTSHISPQKKIKVKDYENFKNFKIEDSFDAELLSLFNMNKEMMKKLKKKKNEADKLVRNELDRIGKCFYLEDYESKYNTNLKTVIGALIGEDNIRNELSRQEKEKKDYFKTIKSIRNFNGFFFKKCS